MAKIPKIRVNTPVPFPTLVQGSGPITISKSKGVWTAGLSFNVIQQGLPPASNPSSDYVLVWDSVSQTFCSVSLTSLTSSIAVGPPSPGTKGGLFSNAGAAHKWVSSINTDGTVTLTQPAFADIFGIIAPAQMPFFSAVAPGVVGASGGGTANFLRADGTWSAPPGGSGAIGPPAPAVLGGVFSNAGVAHQWIKSLNTDGSVTLTQPNYSDITGTPPAIGTPGPATLGGILSNVGAAHKWISSINTDGSVTLTQPSFADISGTASPSQIPVVLFTTTTPGMVPGSGGGTTNFLRADGNWASVGSASITPPAPAVLGGVFSNAGAANKWIAAINTDGSVTLSQPAFSNISGSIAPAQMPLFGAAVAGAVPASGGGTANFLRADGTWTAAGGSVGPPAPAVLGGVFSNVGAANKWISAINTDGSVVLTQPAAANISGLGTFATQNYATPPVLGGTTPSSAAFTAVSITNTLCVAHGGALSGFNNIPGISFDPTYALIVESNNLATLNLNMNGGNGTIVSFLQSQLATGSISVANGNSTAYNTTSDGRLKEDLHEFDAGPILDELEPVNFAWKNSGVRGFGVIAQDAAKVFPDAVVHDELHDTWGADYSKFVPLLLAEIKALRKRVATLEGASQ